MITFERGRINGSIGGRYYASLRSVGAGEVLLDQSDRHRVHVHYMHRGSPRLVAVLLPGGKFVDKVAGLTMRFDGIDCPRHTYANVTLDYCARDAELPTPESSCENTAAYSGTVAITRCGKECQNWAVDTPHEHNFNDVGGHNFCRNPDGEPGTWCYTTDPEQRWDFCDPCGGTTNCTFSVSAAPPTCDLCLGAATAINGENYDGERDHTVSGAPCRNWLGTKFAEVGDHSFCRNPDGSSTIW